MFAPAPTVIRAQCPFQYDQSSMVANIVWQDLPGMFSLWGGSISQLENTNVEF
jgi:hypothetical protein